jgi:hypothetical protein
VIVIVLVLVPLPVMDAGAAVTDIPFATAVWVIAPLPANPPLASVAVTVQVPPTVDGVYVTVSPPLASVVPEVALRLPQEPVALAVVERLIRSPELPEPAT